MRFPSPFSMCAPFTKSCKRIRYSKYLLKLKKYFQKKLFRGVLRLVLRPYNYDSSHKSMPCCICSRVRFGTVFPLIYNYGKVTMTAWLSGSLVIVNLNNVRQFPRFWYALLGGHRKPVVVNLVLVVNQINYY